MLRGILALLAENIRLGFREGPEEESVAWLLKLGRKLGTRPLLLATDDDSCVFLADHAAALKEGFLFPEQPEGLVRSLSNKKQMFYLCKQHGIPAAETAFPDSHADVVEFSKKAQFPVLLKGIDTVAQAQNWRQDGCS